MLMTLLTIFSILGTQNAVMNSKWNVVKRQLVAEHVIFEKCRQNLSACPEGAKRFLLIIDKAALLDGRQQVQFINRAVNISIRPVTDMDQYGVEDWWTTPLQTFTSMAGDCEDYAIAKFVALHELGIPWERLRLAILRNAPEYHMVAQVLVDGHWLTLDNETMEMKLDRTFHAYPVNAHNG